ncbi:hypothetical protein M8818_004369 [Zalaria obscura]|uniref:Uncharacterized protein n=1 Tax=Zalaria obscura TaxID=2024903 RepID=A0ACC3SBQ9_9PEZI
MSGYSTNSIDSTVARLRQRVQETEAALASLKRDLANAETQAREAHDLSQAYQGGMPLGWQEDVFAALSHTLSNESTGPEPYQSQTADHGVEEAGEEDEEEEEPGDWKWPLRAEEYRRYGRQLIMPEVGLQGQLRLRNAKVLVVGAGGLGCPAAAYLAGAGVGTLGLVDGDTVEISNLHRQVAHSSQRVGMKKVDSAVEYLRGLNPNVNYRCYREHLVPQQALEVFSAYDLVLDCTDHPTSRYLISDACVLAGKPLVSASALRTEGQLIVLNNPPRRPGDTDGGPCYRCVFPKPPPAESVVSCGEGGILGPVVGAMGVLQALEAIKLIARGDHLSTVSDDTPMADSTDGEVPSPKAPTASPPTMLLFSAYSSPQFRSIRMRSRRPNCAACSAQATITPESLTSGSLDYVAFCGVTNPVTLLGQEERITPSDFANLALASPDAVLIDVRDTTQFELCNLPGSINIPWSKFPDVVKQEAVPLGKDVFVVCKLGNDSQMAVKVLQEAGSTGRVRDIKGGFRAWKAEVDPSWPEY